MAAPIRSIAPDPYERLLAGAALILLAAVAVALGRGARDWGQVPPLVWAHLATISIALALTPVMLLRPRGSRAHRRLGKLWVAAMAATALLSFGVRQIAHGGFSVIHALSAFVLVMAPVVWWTAATHRVGSHRRAVRGLVTGALLIAGFFTLLPSRQLGHWLFG